MKHFERVICSRNKNQIQKNIRMNTFAEFTVSLCIEINIKFNFHINIQEEKLLRRDKINVQKLLSMEP